MRSLTQQNATDEKQSCCSTNSCNRNEPNFGLLFDIDGVLGRGTHPIPQAVEAFRLLCDPQRTELKVPVAFVTNTAGNGEAKAKLLSDWFGVQIYTDQVILAPTPLSVFKEYHQKHALFIGQEGTLEIAHRLGFVNAITLEDVNAAYPLLDMVDHANRKRIAKSIPEAKPLEPVEVIVLIGEPIRWESSLQLLIDILLTNGKPDHVPNHIPESHIPVIVCNMDLVFMDRAVLPRFGHGAFLTCLQALYRQFTDRELQYTSLVGKPSEITFRYAEHVVSTMAGRMGYTRPIEHLYFFGDNPDVDILGSNLYNNYIRRNHHRTDIQNDNVQEQRVSVANARKMPSTANLLPQTARVIDSILVHTGVYKPDDRSNTRPSYSHRDFQGATDLILPIYEVKNCLEAIRMILWENDFHPSVTNPTIEN